MNTEGLYRISGKKEDIMILQEKYDQGMYSIGQHNTFGLHVCGVTQ